MKCWDCRLLCHRADISQDPHCNIRRLIHMVSSSWRLRHLLLLGLLFWGRQTNFAGRDYTSGIHDGVLIVSPSVREVVRAQTGNG